MKNNPVIPSVSPATPEDIQAITETSRDYAEGWFTADEGRMRQALHPQLAKRSIWYDLQQDTWNLKNLLSAEIMTDATRQGGGNALPEHEKVYEITVLDVFRGIATVKVSSYPYMDYLHLAKVNNRWFIINGLYQVRVGEETEP